MSRSNGLKLRTLLLKLTLLLLACASQANATIALVQHTTKDDASNVSSDTLAYGSNPTINNLLVVAVRGGGSITGITITDSIGNTWTNGTFFAISGTASQQVTWAVNKSTAADTVTITPSASSTLRIAIYEYSGTATSTPLDVQSNNASGTSTAPAATSVTPTAGNELVFGFASTGNNSAQTWTAGTNFTLEDTVGTNKTFATQQWIQTTATATTAPFTITTSDSWIAGVVVFKASSGAASPTATDKQRKLEIIDNGK